MKYLSDIAGGLRGQKMFQVLAEAKSLEREGRDIIHLEIGDPDIASPPHVVEAAYAALQAGHTHYVESSGLIEFRQRAAKMTLKSRGFEPEIDQILVTPGANIQLYLAVACTVNPGDEVVITDPCFVSYRSIIELCGGRVVTVPLREENAFRIEPDDLRRAITPRTRLIIINSPHNPTGSVMSQDDMKAIFEIAVAADVYLLSDEVYGRMVYEDEINRFASPSVYDQCRERTLIVHSFSKSYAMTGWRIGAVTGPADLIHRMGLLLETVTSCTSPFVQYAAIEAMSASQDYVTEMISTYRKRRDLIVAGLNDISGISCLSPGGAFYAFPNIQGTGMSSEEFSAYLLNDGGVATCPGNFFGDAGEGYVRFCFAKSEEQISKALDRMRVLFR